MTPEQRMATLDADIDAKLLQLGSSYFPQGHDSDQDIEIALLKAHIEQMQKDVSEIKASMSDLVDAWKSAGMMVSLVKTAAAIVLSVGVILGAFKLGIMPSEAGK